MILGGGGMFAWDMHRVLCSDPNLESVSVPHSRLDITDFKAVRKFLRSENLFAVVNTVGPLVDFCEERPDTAQRLNVESVANCASVCEEIGVRFVHLSTCGLFGDEKRFYSETDPVKLKTVYARTKYEGELAAARNCRDVLIVRPGWMYGGTPEHKKNFVTARIREARGQDKMYGAGDKFGSPTWTRDAAEAVKQLLLNEELRGVIHVCNTGGASRAEYVGEIMKLAGVQIPVEEVDSSAFPRSASVPDCEMLDNSLLNRTLGRPMHDWKDALERYLRELNQDD